MEVLDTAADISAAFTALNGNTEVIEIVISDNASLLLSAGQVANDAAALGETSNANGSAYAVQVVDSAANITSDLNALQTTGHVAAITVSDSAEITCSSPHKLTSDATVLGELNNADGSPVHIIVSDTAADISSALDALSGDSQVNKIIISDSGSNAVEVSIAQLTADKVALSELYLSNGTTPANVTLSDTATIHRCADGDFVIAALKSANVTAIATTDASAVFSGAQITALEAAALRSACHLATP